MDCVRKHIGQAAVLFQEALQGYSMHRWLAIGHLAEAETEAQGFCPDFAARLRSERIKAQRNDYCPDCVTLLDMCHNLGEMYGGPCQNIAARVAARFADRSRR